MPAGIRVGGWVGYDRGGSRVQAGSDGVGDEAEKSCSGFLGGRPGRGFGIG